jgi:hypothetical protein
VDKELFIDRQDLKHTLNGGEKAPEELPFGAIKAIFSSCS